MAHRRYNYSGSDYAHVTCLNGSDGSVKWRHDFGEAQSGLAWYMFRPFIDLDGYVYVGRSGRTYTGANPTFGPDYHKYTTALTKHDPDDGSVIWEWSEEVVGQIHTGGNGFNSPGYTFLEYYAPAPYVNNAITKVFMPRPRFPWDSALAPIGAVLDPSDGSLISDVLVPFHVSGTQIVNLFDPLIVSGERPSGEIVWGGRGTGSTSVVGGSVGSFLTDADGSYITSYASQPLLDAAYDPTNDYINTFRWSATNQTNFITAQLDFSSGPLNGSNIFPIITGTILTVGDIFPSAHYGNSLSTMFGCGIRHFSNGDILVAVGRVRNSSAVNLANIVRIGHTPTLTSAIWTSAVGGGGDIAMHCHVDRDDDTFFVTLSTGIIHKMEEVSGVATTVYFAGPFFNSVTAGTDAAGGVFARTY